jgi:hypothetical protein
MIDDPAYQRVIELSACLCTAITDAELPEPCYCGPFFGGDVPFDHCEGCSGGKCGQAWVRLVQSYPSLVFPTPTDVGTCASPLAYEWEIGIARCAPTLDDAGNPPTLEQNMDATRLQYADMRAMRRAIQCCWGDGGGDFDDREYVLGVYSALPVQGGCVAGVWTVVTR